MNNIPYTSSLFNASDWYWLADDKRVYASARQVIVNDTDAAYVAWTDLNAATPWPRDDAGNQTDAALQEALAPYGYLFVNLVYYTADARWRKQTGGITVAGVAYRTDRVSSNERNNAYNYALVNTNAIFKWKLPDGTFASLDKTALTKVTMSESGFVQSCFTCENDTLASITGGGITTRAQVDAAFAAISNVFP